jgi:hypothetical protein
MKIAETPAIPRPAPGPPSEAVLGQSALVVCRGGSKILATHLAKLAIVYVGPPGRVERSRPVCRSALCSPFAPAFRSRECHNIRPCTVQSLPPHRGLPAELPHKPLHTGLHHIGMSGTKRLVRGSGNRAS